MDGRGRGHLIKHSVGRRVDVVDRSCMLQKIHDKVSSQLKNCVTSSKIKQTHCFLHILPIIGRCKVPELSDQANRRGNVANGGVAVQKCVIMSVVRTVKLLQK